MDTSSWKPLPGNTCLKTCSGNLVPHIFVWGSCFWFCIPPPSPPPPPAASRHHTYNLSSHNAHTTQLTHNLLTYNSTHTTCSHTTQLTHNLLTHTTCHHTTCSHTHNSTHTQLAHMQLNSHNLSSHNLPYSYIAHTLLIHTHTRVITQLVHTQLVHTQLPPHTQLVHAQLAHTQLVLPDIHLRFTWQAWQLRHWAGSGGAPGSQLTPWTPRLFDLRGRRGTYGTGRALVAHRVLS